ncbi:Na+/H+ antiporter NhaC family protein [Candidatus Enterovibrio escicola]|uniref:Na+/H+ antiporter n=1 Tax=Candidatus Enterovibrio escicola TaxID=1927127 RepID=A0A2A5T803_9GAMM|nr:Na+/H+ antiporter NhaC family protein [Candidatus Enterovibrio escacola]PCS24220.1 Na+/H+ antiporter [Candidatus Enterovibrio escacola]
MNLVDFSSSSQSVLPAILPLIVAIITRRVILSLGLGIVYGSLLLNDFSLSETFSYLSSIFLRLIVENDHINFGTMNIVAFLILVGMITALMTLSGGSRAFSEWAGTRIKSKRGARLLAVFLGVFIFIDDYFNSLAVGAISRPVTDRFHVSRAKLAYILDSTAAPVCVIMPASSWGAYIITVIGGILVTHGVDDYTALSAFVHMIPMNFYAIFALLMVYAVAWFQLDVGLMQRLEYQASTGNRLRGEENYSNLFGDELGINENSRGRVSNLTIPIFILIITTIFWIVFSGSEALELKGKTFSILGAFENTNVSKSLVYGSGLSLISALIPVFKQRLPVSDVSRTMWIGARSMFSAISILFFSWLIGHVIGDMETGRFLSMLIQGNLPKQLLPVILFLLSAVMAFSTGTSWGTFGIMLPIAGDLSSSTDLSLMLPMLAAVLSGAVFGDHCSPISDTTILSATGAHCGHMDHVSSQLPYAVANAGLAVVGYLVLGYTESLSISLLIGMCLFILVCLGLTWISRFLGKLT